MKTYIIQATPKRDIAYRKTPYAKTKGTAYHWTYVIRATDSKVRKRIAKDAEYAVACRKIKYSNEGDKNADLYDAVKPLKFNCKRLKKRATTNCCNFASVCCRYARLKTPRKSSARTLPQKWAKITGFKVFRYRHGKTKLKRGDILDSNIKPKVHTAVYIGKRGRK